MNRKKENNRSSICVKIAFCNDKKTMDNNDFSGNPLAVYPKFTPAKFTEFKPKKHPLAGFRFAEGGRMQDPLMAVKPNQELVTVENAIMNESESVATPVATATTIKKQKAKRNKPLWQEIAKLLSKRPEGLLAEEIAKELGETKSSVATSLGKARDFNPEILSQIDKKWVLKRMPAGMEDDWEVSQAVGRIFTPPEPALPEFDQASEFVEAVREIGRRVMATDERLALLLHSGAEWVEQVAAVK